MTAKLYFNEFDEERCYTLEHHQEYMKENNLSEMVLDRGHRLKALGNAIVPQIAFEIFKAIANSNTPSP